VKRRTSVVLAGTAGPRVMKADVMSTPAIETTMATAMRDRTSQVPRRAATIEPFCVGTNDANF
jgi:hypothetical protein